MRPSRSLERERGGDRERRARGDPGARWRSIGVREIANVMPSGATGNAEHARWPLANRSRIQVLRGSSGTNANANEAASASTPTMPRFASRVSAC